MSSSTFRVLFNLFEQWLPKELVRLLFQFSFDLNPWLDQAALCGSMEDTRELIKMGADRHRSSKSKTLTNAVHSGSEPLVQFLILNGSNVNANWGAALIAATVCSNLKIFKILHLGGANLGKHFYGPLLAASLTDSADILEYLYLNGAPHKGAILHYALACSVKFQCEKALEVHLKYVGPVEKKYCKLKMEQLLRSNNLIYQPNNKNSHCQE